MTVLAKTQSPASLTPMQMQAPELPLGKVFSILDELQPGKFAIINGNLLRDPEYRESVAFVLELYADILEEHDDIEAFITAADRDCADLIQCLEANEEGFYKNAGVRQARQNLYALRAGFEHAGGNGLALFVCDRENFLTGTKEYFARLQTLLLNAHKSFQNRTVPAYLATTWPMESSLDVNELAELGQEVLLMTVHSLPHFETDEDQFAFLNANPIAGTNKQNAFAVVLNSHADVGVTTSRTDDTPLPVTAHLAFAARMAFAEVGTNLSGNLGIGLKVKGHTTRYNLSQFDLRDSLSQHGVISLIGNKLRGRKTICVGGSIPVFEDYAGMDAYLSICRSLFQHGVDLIDASWNKDSVKNLKNGLKPFFDSLYDANLGRVVLNAPVLVDQHVEISRDPITGAVTIVAQIQLPGVIDSVVFKVDPTIPSKEQSNKQNI